MRIPIKFRRKVKDNYVIPKRVVEPDSRLKGLGNDSFCLLCGHYVPEGMMVCTQCEREMLDKQ